MGHEPEPVVADPADEGLVVLVTELGGRVGRVGRGLGDEPGGQRRPVAAAMNAVSLCRSGRRNWGSGRHASGRRCAGTGFVWLRRASPIPMSCLKKMRIMRSRCAAGVLREASGPLPAGCVLVNTLLSSDVAAGDCSPTPFMLVLVEEPAGELAQRGIGDIDAARREERGERQEAAAHRDDQVRGDESPAPATRDQIRDEGHPRLEGPPGGDADIGSISWMGRGSSGRWRSRHVFNRSTGLAASQSSVRCR